MRRQRAGYTQVVRARLVLMSAAGRGTREISRALGIGERTVRKWKARFEEMPRLEGLKDAARSGRPSTIPVAVRCQLVQLACERPDGEKSPAPFRDVWSYKALAEAIEATSGHRMSVSEVGRILRFKGLRPHRVKQWLKSSDPDFVAKAKRVCQMYLHPPKDTVVLCVDEKPMQVLERGHRMRRDRRDASVRYEYEYKRHETQALLAAFDVKTGRVLGRVVPHRDASALVSFMNALARHYRNKKVCIVWDNLNIHYDGKDARWASFNARHGGRFRFVYTPIHASWMNQVEIWFSILVRKLLKRGNFTSLEDLKAKVLAFVEYFNRTMAKPFKWTYQGKVLTV